MLFDIDLITAIIHDSIHYAAKEMGTFYFFFWVGVINFCLRGSKQVYLLSRGIFYFPGHLVDNVLTPSTSN